MLTQRGWATAGGSLALMVLWFLFGEADLGVAAFGLLAAAVSGLFFVVASRPRLQIDRHTNPAAVHEGDHATVTLSFKNAGRTLRHLNLADEVVGLGSAEFSVAAVPRQSRMTATYRILCQPRGIYSIGPASISVNDPLGLATSSSTVGPVTALAVYPAVETLTGFPAVRGRNLVMSARRPEHNQRGGEDFYTLREYQHGDDLRRVHWPSSAKRDELMIRQLDTPWQARALVLLDVRSRSYPDGVSFERAVSGAASVIRHLSRGGYAADLWAGGALIDATDYAPPMELLAGVSPDRDIDLLKVGASIRQAESGGILVMVGGDADPALLGVRRMLQPTHPVAVLMSVSNSNAEASAISQSGVVSVSVAPAQPWAPAWAGAMGGSWQPASAE